MGKKRTLDDNLEDRDKLDKEYWAASERLNDEFDKLMAEED